MKPLARITGGSRLHLGFYNINYGGIRYGGLGIYLWSPRVVVEALSGGEGVGGFPDELVSEVRLLIQNICENRRDFSLVLKEAPPLHVGLGASTQILLSTAKLLSYVCRRDLGFEEMVRLTRRGRYSGIGIHAFRSGGFIVDGGLKPGEDYPPLVYRSTFPHEWRIVLLLPKKAKGLTDSEEAEILDSLPEALGEGESLPLISLAFMQILRGISTGDFDSFASGVESLQRRVGEVFSRYQGDVFSSRETSMAVEYLSAAGFKGTGQSSWGPVAYGFSDVRDLDGKLKRLRGILEKEGEGWEVILTRARNRGARVRVFR